MRSRQTATAVLAPRLTSPIPGPAWRDRALTFCRRRCRLQALAFDIAATEARERARIANGLHDDLGQVLAMVRFKLGELAMSADVADIAVIHELRALLAQATEATRQATFELQSPVLQQLGLQAAIESLAERMNRLCGMNIEVRGELPRSPSLVHCTAQAIVFRVVRELLLNVHKHAHARRVVVEQGIADERLCIAVRDDGIGFERSAGPWRFSAAGGYGLHSAEAQMEAVGGKLVVSARPGHGTLAKLSLPLLASVPWERAGR